MANKKYRKRAINIVMLNGDAAGVLEVSLPGSQSMAYKIPRGQLYNCKTLGVNDYNSVYFLFGGVNKNKPIVYIGQAGVRKNGSAILARLNEHDKTKDYWTEAFIFTNTSDLFGPTELNYLENTFCKMAVDAGKYEVKNGNNPNQGNIKRIEAELDSYVYDAETLLYILGYKVFDDDGEKNPVVILEGTHAKSMQRIPPLPDKDLAVGKFIHQAMRELSNAKYQFTDTQLAELLSKESSNRIFNIGYPFMKLLDYSEVNPHQINGVGRYYSPYMRGRKGILDQSNIFTFAGKDYLITKETFDRKHNKEKFINWYCNLK